MEGDRGVRTLHGNIDYWLGDDTTTTLSRIQVHIARKREQRSHTSIARASAGMVGGLGREAHRRNEMEAESKKRERDPVL